MRENPVAEINISIQQNERQPDSQQMLQVCSTGLDQRCAVLNTRIFVIHKTRKLSAERMGTAKYSVPRISTVTDIAHRRS
jgi:hypothetical protein